jgi:hypothetical protein
MMTAWGQPPSKPTEVEQAVIHQVQVRAKKAKLAEIGQRRSAHFIALGDAAARFEQEALDRICEPLGKDFLAHFRRRGFKVAYPDYRMTVVTLKDDQSFKAYIDDNPEAVVAGQYELDTNQLIMFDLRSSQINLNAEEVRVNTFALVHETIHLLCFNTGLLARTADVPRAISEGLATDGELWVPDSKAKPFGAINRPRLAVLRNAGKQAVAWIPIADLLTQDKLFDDPNTSQLAYAESWLLVHYFLQPDRVRKFQAYLEGVPKAGDGKDRVAYAKRHLGPLQALDQAVRRYGKGLRR